MCELEGYGLGLGIRLERWIELGKGSVKVGDFKQISNACLFLFLLFVWGVSREVRLVREGSTPNEEEDEDEEEGKGSCGRGRFCITQEKRGKRSDWVGNGRWVREVRRGNGWVC